MDLSGNLSPGYVWGKLGVESASPRITAIPTETHDVSVSGIKQT